MQGLLRKELYMAAKYCRSYILIAAVFAVASFWSDNMLILIYPVLMAGIVPVSLLSYDEKCRWDTMQGCSPIPARPSFPPNTLPHCCYWGDLPC